MEEQATLVSIQEDGNMKNMDDKVSDSWEIGKIALACEDYRMKDKGEGK